MTKKLFKGILITFLIIFGGIVFILSNQIGGFRTFIIASSSMSPVIQTGSLIVTSYTHPNTLKVGDIITFLPPTNERKFVTHRITKTNQKQTLTTIKTKGDNNKQEDNWILAGGAVVGKVIFAIPYLGFFFSFFQNKLVIILCILLPTIYIVLSEIQNIISLFKQNKKKNTEPTVISVFILYILGMLIATSSPSHALLTDSVSLAGNTITNQLSENPDDCDDSKHNNKHKPKNPNHKCHLDKEE